MASLSPQNGPNIRICPIMTGTDSCALAERQKYTFRQHGREKRRKSQTVGRGYGKGLQKTEHC
jgi:hypothetical protein